MRRHRLMMFGGAAAVVVTVLLYRIVGREVALSALARVSQEQASLPVEIVMPQPGPLHALAGAARTLRAWCEAPIFAQVSGYVQSWSADFGTPPDCNAN